MKVRSVSWHDVFQNRFFNVGACCLQQAGLFPTIDEVQLFAYHLPKASLSNILVSIFRMFTFVNTDLYSRTTRASVERSVCERILSFLPSVTILQRNVADTQP